MMHTDTAPLLIVTGLAGAGMSSSLKHLQDMGYETFDNFPLTLVESLIASDSPRAIAIGIDARSRGFSPEAVISLCQQLSGKLLFLTADEAELHKRFTETRRRHPLAKDRPVSAGIKAEQDLMMPLRCAADHVIDTTGMSVHVQHQIIEGLFGQGVKGHLTVSLMSFGFRFGLPREADIVLDVRFLKNPFWQPELKALSGLDQAIGDYVAGDPDFNSFLEGVENLLNPLLPRYAAEGKSYLTIAIGCTGGRHRSVYTVERLKPWLEARGLTTNSTHRDINR
ncbi:MAG: RNase adapter RapZ [Micavibrio aeruginosavorus]|uniref:RNase adapter RapZ n=1 Tax=Micavibrio aeruginosavorus TaxID=349221 RepID=A0A7T5R2J1_9BACT|nr:MAG: RNase adapter RapZ [Micavibrio aeruginosavorus]